MIQLGNITLYSMQEAADKLNVGRRTITNYVKEGKLHVYKKVARRNFISEAELLHFVEDGAHTLEDTIKEKEAENGNESKDTEKEGDR